MTSFWRCLIYSASRGTSTNSNRLYDEERGLDWNSGLWRGRRLKHLWTLRPLKTLMLLLLTDLIVVGLLLQTLNPLIILLYRNKQLFNPHVVLSSHNTSDIWHQTNQSNNIPRILHQTTATEVIPDDWIQSQRSCKDAYSEFEYMVNLSSSEIFIYLYQHGCIMKGASSFRDH